MKVYGKPIKQCYKVEVREKDLEITRQNSEWMEERVEEELLEPRGPWYEESAGGTKVSYTPDE
ncbi:hypothetical protein A2U01_0086177, partial [Trifolium medium]|nr:hypothetical protein [Trifolium medium]